jgi:hypothetical protein
MVARSEPWPAIDIVMVVAIVAVLGTLCFKAFTVYAVPPLSFTPSQYDVLLLDATTALESASACSDTLVPPAVDRHTFIGHNPERIAVVELEYHCEDAKPHAFIWSARESP